MFEASLVGARPGTGCRGISWGDRGRSVVSAVLATALVVAGLAAATASAPAGASGAGSGAGVVQVIVERPAGSGRAADRAVELVGGTVGDELAIIDSFTATVPAVAVDRLTASPAVGRVTRDGQVHLQGNEWRADKDLGSLQTVTKAAGVQGVWERTDRNGETVTGRGVGVALIDSGVVPVNGLTTPGRVVDGPDLSFDSQVAGLAHLDTFGHGTHMAGIIAGRDDGVQEGGEGSRKDFVGVAPDATLLNVKVAAANGAVDVSQVIAAIDWVVRHRNDDGVNVRVINLSFGTDGRQSYLLDPLAHAAEEAWRQGLVVVVAAGNDGPASTSLTNPAMDPFVLAVGASEPNGSARRRDDRVADFSSGGSATRAPDLVAPGRSLVSLRVPGSSIDVDNPTAVVAEDRTGEPRFFRGSGTSQAAAFVSGVVALLLQQHPSLSPDQVKELLTSTADPIAGTDVRLQGAGLIDVEAAAAKTPPSHRRSAQTFPLSTGLGSLELARGTSHVADPEDGTELVGEIDIFGEAWDGRSWSDGYWSDVNWTGRSWSGRSWSENSWNGRSWSGRSWSVASWTGRSWSGRSWSSTATWR